MVWKPGQTGNPNGRPRKYPEPPPGVNAVSYYGQAALRDEYRTLAEQEGLEDPILFQHKRMMDESLPIGLRCAIANQIAPFYRPKLGIATPPKFIETIVEVPKFQTVDEAESFLNKIPILVGTGELSLSTALDMSTLVRNWISADISRQELELKRLASGESVGDQRIVITGGLPELPGTTIGGWPHKLNGHGPIDHLIEPGTVQIESTPAQPGAEPSTPGPDQPLVKP